MTRSRPTWDEYFVGILEAAAQRATCDRGRAACVITRNEQILVTGYVGSPPGFEHCDDIGHLMVHGHCVRTVHAEQNALASAAKRGITVRMSTAYCTMTPCRICAMLLLTAGVARVVSVAAYQNREGVDILRRGGVEFEQLSEGMPYVP